MPPITVNDRGVDKENFFVRYCKFDSVAHVNQRLEQWMVDLADKRDLPQFTETPEQRFALEQAHLQSLQNRINQPSGLWRLNG